MRIIRGALIVICLLVSFIFAWLWWTRPVRVDMAAYVPADSIVYVEADSLHNLPELVLRVPTVVTQRGVHGAEDVLALGDENDRPATRLQCAMNVTQSHRVVSDMFDYVQANDGIHLLG